MLLANPDDAEEVGQEVFLKLFQACQTETRPMQWGPWLTRVAVNACRDRRRSGWWKLWRESSVELQEGSITSAEPSPEAQALGLSPGTVKRHLFRAIRHLRAALEVSG